MLLGDMVSHKFNENWLQGKIFSFPPDDPDSVVVLWANGDLEKVYIEDLEPLGWNLHRQG